MSVKLWITKLRRAADALEDLQDVMPAANPKAAKAIRETIQPLGRVAVKPLHWTKKPENAKKVARWKRIMSEVNRAKKTNGHS